MVNWMTDLSELTEVLESMPGTDWSLAGDPRRPYGLNYRINGGIRQVGGDGSLSPEMVRFIFIARQMLPSLLQELEMLTEENMKLRQEAAAAKQQAATAYGKLSAYVRSNNQKEKS